MKCLLSNVQPLHLEMRVSQEEISWKLVSVDKELRHQGSIQTTKYRAFSLSLFGIRFLIDPKTRVLNVLMEVDQLFQRYLKGVLGLRRKDQRYLLQKWWRNDYAVFSGCNKAGVVLHLLTNTEIIIPQDGPLKNFHLFDPMLTTPNSSSVEKQSKKSQQIYKKQ